MQWQDYSGVLRASVVTVDRVLEMLLEDTPFKAAPYALECTVYNSLFPDRDRHGKYLLSPDWSSLRKTFATDEAAVMCDLQHAKPGLAPDSSRCPRRALDDVLGRVNSLLGLDFLVGFEVEFAVGGSCQTGYHAAASLQRASYQKVKECVKRLVIHGVAIHSIHSDGHRGQWHIALGPLPPKQAVDQFIFVQTFIKDTIAINDEKTTLSPSSENGQHMHISVNGRNTASVEEPFLAGVLKMLPSLCSLCMPLDLSYRLLSQKGVGDVVGWGTESQLAPVLKINPCHWEIRCIDATANMYLAVAGVLSAGILGVQCNEQLTWPDLSFRDSATESAAPSGEKMPETIDEALDNLEKNSNDLADLMGHAVLDHYIKMKRYESVQVKAMEISDKAKRESRKKRFPAGGTRDDTRWSDILKKLF